MIAAAQIVFVCVFGYAAAGEQASNRASQSKAPDVPTLVMSLPEAVEKGLVHLSIEGQGSSSGDSIQMRIKRVQRRPMRLTLAPGTVLKSLKGSVQNMIIAAIKGVIKSSTMYEPKSAVELADDEIQTYLVEAYCLDFEKDNPGEGDGFLFDDVDNQMLAVIRAVPKEKQNADVIQAAIWLADGVAEDKIKERFPISDPDMLIAKEAIKNLPRPPVR